jgi:hypothetical protein
MFSFGGWYFGDSRLRCIMKSNLATADILAADTQGVKTVRFPALTTLVPAGKILPLVSLT